ncbi:MAG: amidohydrolase [Chloroflexi bacterium]|nr:amidohydrolase [Chloroflexota bacterium]
MTAAVRAVDERTPGEVEVSVVDVDVHPAPRSNDELRLYLPEPWRSRDWPPAVLGRAASLIAGPLYFPPGTSQRADAYPPSGGPPCSDPDFTARQLFDEAGVDYGILVPRGDRPLANPEHEAVLAATVNIWLAETWLSKYNPHGRYKAAIRVGPNDAELAVREIERWAGHPHFVQVMLVPHVRVPFGQAQFHPIYEAAVRHNLPLATHVNQTPSMALLTPVGFVSYFFEYHQFYPELYATHLISLLCEGVFEKFPALKVVFMEGGVSWLVPLLWRLDKHWRELRAEVPGLRRRPSEYVREHLRVTTQPVEEPQQAEHLARVLEWLDGEHLLMFATDYPHWDGDYRPSDLFRGLPERVRRRILRDNASELYGLPPTRPAGRDAV